ncbi:MAG: inositol monophosphatase [Bacteroidales bacterium]|nr:inositol monophosphatase [Bacteroidales bacterium]
MNYENLCYKICEVVTEAGEYALEQWEKNPEITSEEKSIHNYVTKVDIYCEKYLIEKLSKLLPGASFLTEEINSTNTLTDKTFIIDPLDGTTNYIHKLPPVAISVALYNYHEPLIGVIYEISRKECYYTWKNGDAYLNKKKIRVSNIKSLDKSLIITGFPLHDITILNKILDVIGHFFKYSSGVRRLGSAATDLAYIASGKGDAFYEHNLNPWDVAAGAFLVKQAGGVVSDFSGGENYLFGKEIVASNPYIYNEILAIMKRHFKN